MVNPELYMYDGEVIAKAEEMGKPGLVTIKQKQVGGLVRGSARRGTCVPVSSGCDLHIASTILSQPPTLVMSTGPLHLPRGGHGRAVILNMHESFSCNLQPLS